MNAVIPHRPLFFFFFHRFFTPPHLITKRETGIPFLRGRSVAFLMINSREILAVVAMEFSMKREFRKIQCPLFFYLSTLTYTHIYIYVFIYVYIYTFRSLSLSLLLCYTLNGTSDRRNPPTAGNFSGRGKRRGSKKVTAKGRRLPFRIFNASNKFV